MGQGMGSAFPDGVAIENLEIMVRPPAPLLLFKWRFVGKFNGTYADSAGIAVRGYGQIVDISGVCKMVLGANMEFGDTEIFYDVPTLMQAMSQPKLDENGAPCPVSGKVGACPMLDIMASS